MIVVARHSVSYGFVAKPIQFPNTPTTIFGITSLEYLRKLKIGWPLTTFQQNNILGILTIHIQILLFFTEKN